MKNGTWQKWIRSAQMQEQPLPGIPLVELAGDGRVLIENHQGVLEYGLTQIRVRVKWGSILVSGEGLCLRHMTRSRLVICGQISGIGLERRA